MVAAATRAHRQLGVNYNYRSVPAHCLIRAALAHNTFGSPALFTALTHAYLWPHMLDLIRFFFGDPVEVTGALADDQALRPPVSVASGRPWVYPPSYPAADPEPMLYHPSIAASATLRYRNPDGSHFLATLSSSAFVPLEDNFWSFMFYGRTAAVGIHRATRNQPQRHPQPRPLARKIAALPPYSYPESFDDSVAAFAEAILHSRPAPVTGEDGLAVLRLDAAITNAMQTGRAVPLADSPHQTVLLSEGGMGRTGDACGRIGFACAVADTANVSPSEEPAAISAPPCDRNSEGKNRFASVIAQIDDFDFRVGFVFVRAIVVRTPSTTLVAVTAEFVIDHKLVRTLLRHADGNGSFGDPSEARQPPVAI